MNGTTDFKSFLSRLMSRDEAAYAEFNRDYLPPMRKAARHRLKQSKVRNWLDEDDICQDVLTSFFRWTPDDPRLDEPCQLLKRLRAMVRRSVSRHLRHELTPRRDFHRLSDRGVDEFELAAAGGDPADKAATLELEAKFLAGLSEEERQLHSAWQRGASWREIAKTHGGEPDARRIAHSRCVRRTCREIGLEMPRRKGL